MAQHWSDKLKGNPICPAMDLDWARIQSSFDKAWASCQDGSFMIWLLSKKIHYPDPILRHLAVDFAQALLPYIVQKDNCITAIHVGRFMAKDFGIEKENEDFDRWRGHCWLNLNQKDSGWSTKPMPYPVETPNDFYIHWCAANCISVVNIPDKQGNIIFTAEQLSSIECQWALVNHFRESARKKSGSDASVDAMIKAQADSADIIRSRVKANDIWDYWNK